MPTVGWIQETAIDRYWERGGLGEQYPPIPKIHYCPYCDKQFESTGDLSTHISVDHPIERPVIFIGNRTALSEQTIRAQISKNEVELTHVHKIRVSRDGGEYKECTMAQLKETLYRTENAHYSIILINSDPNGDRSVEASYIFRIKIADQAELEAVDEIFIRTLAIDDVRMSDVRRFSDACSGYLGADEYASALAVYVTGVLIKDQNESSGISLPLSAYKEKMQQALATLHDFDRPIPRAICASIKFNLNDFRNPPLPCRAELLDAANEYYSAVARNIPIQLSEPGEGREGSQELPACPIDRDSFDLLSVFQKIRIGISVKELVTELSASTISRRLSDYDLSKMRVLTALAANRAKDKVVGQQILEDLVNDPVFGPWAESQLEGAGE